MGLEPITFDLFAKIQEKREEELNKKRDDLMYFCNVCRKTFSTQPTLDQHLKSKRHRDELDKKPVDSSKDEITSVKSKAQHKLDLLKEHEESESDLDNDVSDCVVVKISHHQTVHRFHF